ncbi:hypothetical protein [Lactobacillus sp. PV034]|uniref:hypothetical protein n=1 Tax=Lactobacillus sp. PV034 TaxID=2594495 RepID=UPI002240D378|nr:hypothetical protein [Lactobacillus sp. PV034]QNQ81452.1 hypothetical protein FP432_07710 [Lactobacillus sp. PV034]
MNQIEEVRNLTDIAREMELSRPHISLKEDTIIQNERLIIQLNQEIRKSWIKKCCNRTAPIYKSPLWNTNVKDLQNYSYHYSYETLLNDENDFADLLGYQIKNMTSKTFLFSSGMNAISNILNCFSSLIKEKLIIQASAGYFETKYLLKILKSMGNEIYTDFTNNVNANLFYFEPIKYDASLSTTDLDKLISRVNQSTHSLKFIIMDSTMHNKTKIFDELKNKIYNLDNVVLCDIRSGLKLDQEGLELSNLGICSIFVSKNNMNLFQIVKRYIEHYKNLTGANLSFYSLVLSHYFKGKIKSVEYTQKVKKQIMWASKAITSDSSRIIKRLIWRNKRIANENLIAPFLFIELFSQEEEEYLNYIHNFQKFMKKRGTPIDYRNSWGFRMPSVEYFNDIFTRKKYIKFYPGSFQGLTAVNAIYYLNRI